jgi:uncharacterized peroxidase-related enzyme
MPHISLPPGLPGITGPMAFRPETGGPLSALAEALLVGPSPLTRGERELIATYVSHLNDCEFCCNSHGAAACALLDGRKDLVASVKSDYRNAPIGEKMKALLAIAAKVQGSGRNVTGEDIEEARRHGATDVEIHDAVLIAAAFCMFNRYVDGLATWTPDDPAMYDVMGERLAASGYTMTTRPDPVL